MKNRYTISFLFLFLIFGNTPSIAKKTINFDEGKTIVDSLLQLPWDRAPFDREEDGLQAIALAQQIGYKIGEAKASRKLGAFYCINYKEQKAFEYFEQAKTLFYAHGTKTDQLGSLYDLTQVYRIFNWHKEALDYGKQTIDLSELLQDSLIMANALWDLALINLNIHQKDKYFELGTQAISIFEKIGKIDGIVATYIHFSGLMEDMDSTLWYLNKAKSLLPQIENPDARRGNTLGLNSTIASIHLDNKNYEQAEIPARIALQIAKEKGMVESIAVLQYYLAEIQFYHYQNYQKAIEFADSSLQYERSISRYFYVVPQAQLLAKIYDAAKQPNEALAYAEIAMLYQDSLYWANRKNDAADIEKEYEMERQQTEIKFLENQRRTRTILGIAGMGFLLFVVGFFYRQHQLKSKHLKIQEQLSQQLQEQKEQLAGLNETKDRFFAIIAHDMRNAVYNFRGVTDKINYFIQRKQPERIDEFGGQINTAVGNLTNLMNNLLDWALQQKNAFPCQPVNIDLSIKANHILKSIYEQADRKQVDIVASISEDIFVFADENALATILRNLIGNAVKFTSAKGKVEIDAVKKGDEIVIKISDTGTGIDKEQIENLFQLNKQKTTRGTAGEKGSGLGLVLVKELVEMNKGKIKVVSEEGKGTIVQIILPAVEVPVTT